MLCNLKEVYNPNFYKSYIDMITLILKLSSTTAWSHIFNQYKSFNNSISYRYRIKVVRRPKRRNSKKRKVIKIKSFNKVYSISKAKISKSDNASIIPNLQKIAFFWSNNNKGWNKYALNLYTNSTFRSESSLYKKSLKRFIKEVKNNRKSLNKPLFTSSSLNVVDPIKLKSVLSLKFFKKFYKVRKWLTKVREYKPYGLKIRRSRRSKYRRFTKSIFSFERRKRKLRNTKRAYIRKKINRILKKSRTLFRKILMVKSKGKNRLVKRVKLFNHKSFLNKLLLFEMSLMSILVKSPLSNSINDASFLIKNHLIYINGISNSSTNATIDEGDRLQLSISKSSYRWLESKRALYNKSFKKSLRIFYRKKFRSKGRFKKRSYRYPKSLIKYSIFTNKTPSLLEFDLSSLTCILLHKPTHFNELNSMMWRWINLNAHSLYLWKLVN